MKRVRTQVFEGDLTVADCKRYLPLHFDVPPGTAELRIDLSYEPLCAPFPPGVENMICITLLDPAGFRGAQHRGENRKVVEIGPGGATPGFRPGPLPPGRWTLELDLFMVLPGVTLSYRAEVRLRAGAEVARAAQGWQWPQPVRREPGWYRGDLHTHTLHSDGSQTVAELLEMGRRHGLDFMALTDHNTVAQLDDPAAVARGDLAVIPGMELTTHWGHAVALGVTRWIDWRVGHQGRTMAEAVREVQAEGGLAVLAHLAAMGDPFCTGCAWLYTDQMPGQMDAMEVWNGPWFEVGNNGPTNLRIWQEWLEWGHRIPAVAGTDVHGEDRYGQGAGFSIVYARELSAEAILEGVARGHVMLSTGPSLYLEAALADGRMATMGDAVARSSVRSVAVRWQGAPAGGQVRWVAGGEAAATWRGEQGEEVAPLPSGARWAVAELRGPDGALLAMTNPLYLEG